MGLSNYRLALENKHAVLKGELSAALKELHDYHAKAERMEELHWRAHEISQLISAAELLLKHEDPDWQPSLLKPRQPRKWSGPFKPGDRGRLALVVLRENGGWMRPYDIAITMLAQAGHDPKDRVERQRLANTLGNFLKKYEGDLVESRGGFAKEWRVIR